MLKMILIGKNVRMKGCNFGDLLWARGEREWFSKMSTQLDLSVGLRGEDPLGARPPPKTGLCEDAYGLL